MRRWQKNEKKHNSCYLFYIRQVAQGSRSKISTKREVDLRRKNPSNNIHGKENLRAKKPLKREIDLREKPTSNTSRTKRKVNIRTWQKNNKMRSGYLFLSLVKVLKNIKGKNQPKQKQI